MPLALKKLFWNALRRFKFEELEDVLILVFPEISWNYIKSHVSRYGNYSAWKVTGIIEEMLNDSNIEKKDLEKRLMKLELIDTSKHKRRIWYTYRISGSNHKCNHFGPKEFTQKLLEYLSPLRGDNIWVDTVIFNGVLYTSIKLLGSSNKSISHYFALYLGQKYIFSSKKTALQIYIDGIMNIMCYTKYKRIDLKGSKDLKSLIHLLRTKNQSVLNPANIISDILYTDAAPVTQNITIDYTQDKQREHCAEKCYNINPSVFDTLAVSKPSYFIDDDSSDDEEFTLQLSEDTGNG